MNKENPLNPEIIFQDSHIIVLNKPVGLTVNRSETTRGQVTLQDWIERELRIMNYQPADATHQALQAGELRIQEVDDFIKRSGIVHRLDKDTSGIIIVSKTPLAFSNLQQQFKDRIVEKIYLALVWGEILASGEVNAPITRNPYNRKRFGVFIGGKEANTSYRVLKSGEVENEKVTLLEVKPKTGRTHQIRVHLNYIGHPVIGDPLYSGRKLGKKGLRIFKRLMLHAWKISFLHPGTKRQVAFEANVPEEFRISETIDSKIENSYMENRNW